MSFQELAKFWMACQKLLVVGQRRILGQLFRNRGMAAKELAKACHLPTVVAVALVFPPVEARLRLHEGVRVLAELLAHFRMRLQILLQGWMVLDPLAVVDQRRILAQLFGDLPMAVEEPVHVSQLPASRVTIAISIPVTIGLMLVVALFLPHESIRVLRE